MFLLYSPVVADNLYLSLIHILEVKTILTETNPDNIHKLVTENDIDIILLDMNFRSSINTGNEGLFWLKEIKKRRQAVIVEG